MRKLVAVFLALASALLVAPVIESGTSGSSQFFQAIGSAIFIIGQLHCSTASAAGRGPDPHAPGSKNGVYVDTQSDVFA